MEQHQISSEIIADRRMPTTLSALVLMYVNSGSVWSATLNRHRDASLSVIINYQYIQLSSRHALALKSIRVQVLSPILTG
jgi:hypothetical protein